MDVMDGRIPPQACILVMGDNAAYVGWLKQPNTKENYESNLGWTMKQYFAQKVAYLVLETDSCLYS